MLRRSKNRATKQAASSEVLTYESSEQQIFENVSREVFAIIDAFVLSDKPKVTVLQINNIDPHLPLTNGGAIHYVSRLHIEALLETVYTGFGAVNPTDDLSKWAYDTRGTEHIAETPTQFGFKIVETRFRLEDNSPDLLPEPKKCGFYTLELVRPD